MGKNVIMWAAILLVAALLLALSIVFISGRICRFDVWRGFFSNQKTAFLCAALLVLAVLGGLWVWIGYINAMVCFIHALAIWLLCDGAAWTVHMVTGTAPRYYIAGAAAILITVLWLAFGWYNAHNVRRTAYELTGNVSGEFRIAGFSDSHIGALFSGSELSSYVDRINAETPDAVVIVGDFIDDDTSRVDMEQACNALGGLRAKYGIYYVFGNHDSGYYSASRRGYSRDDLIDRLTANGVRVLEDETVHLTGNIYLCGRLDGQYTGRMSASEMTAGLSSGDYVIMLDHQPTDYAAEMAAGAGLVLSGHTHGGQFIPIRGLIGVLGKNELVYGHEKRSGTDFIVSSGIADWAIRFKTGCVSEYFVIDVKKQAAS